MSEPTFYLLIRAVVEHCWFPNGFQTSWHESTTKTNVLGIYTSEKSAKYEKIMYYKKHCGYPHNIYTKIYPIKGNQEAKSIDFNFDFD